MRAATLTRPVRPADRHLPTPAPDGTPGVCRCGLPLGMLNLRHQPDADQLARDRDAAELAQQVERARYGDRD